MPTAADFPAAPLDYLETVWFQVAGTLCNLSCAHCLVSAHPNNRTHDHMTLAEVRAILDEAESLGVREFYFTGGEPFLNRDMIAILAETLRRGPANVLTNGTLITEALAAELRRLSDGSRFSLELRISLDGVTAETNDPIRGAGSFEAILRGLRQLATVGLNPVLTVTEASPELGRSTGGREAFYKLLNGLGLDKPRVKILSLFRIGEETRRTGGYRAYESLRGLELSPEDLQKLQCTTSRIATREGIYVCPILVNVPAARLGNRLSETRTPFPLAHPACHTCHDCGVTCRT